MCPNRSSLRSRERSGHVAATHNVSSVPLQRAACLVFAWVSKRFFSLRRLQESLKVIRGWPVSNSRPSIFHHRSTAKILARNLPASLAMPSYRQLEKTWSKEKSLYRVNLARHCQDEAISGENLEVHRRFAGDLPPKVDPIVASMQGISKGLTCRHCLRPVFPLFPCGCLG